MADVIDQAQEYDELFRRNALTAHLNKSKMAMPPKRRPARTKRECADCGVSIPVKRLKANPAATRCVACQILVEQGVATPCS
jgi:phage/conjugal plasmid C-4 type zinc finger TraR family protein